jgi:hypothetical protein
LVSYRTFFYEEIIKLHLLQNGAVTAVLYARAQMNFYPYFPYLLANVGKIQTEDFPRNSVEQL